MSERPICPYCHCHVSWMSGVEYGGHTWHDSCVLEYESECEEDTP